MKRANSTFLVLFLLALAIRIVWVLSTDNAPEGDAASRLNIAQIWLYSFWKFPSVFPLEILNPSLDWLPLHFYLIGIVSYISNDLIYAPRLFTALIGALTLIPLHRLCLVRYDRSTATIAIALLAFYGMHIYVSGLILSEPFYIFSLLWCYYFIEKYKAGVNDTKWIFWIAVSLFCCCLLRYEGWVFAMIVILIIPFIKKMPLKNLMILLLVPAIAVCFVMVCEVMQGQHPLRGILYSDYEVRQSNRFNGTVNYTDLLPAYLPAYFIAALVILLDTLKTKKRPDTLILLLYLLPLCAFLFKLANGTITPQARYLVIYMVPGIVLIAHFIYRVFEKFRFPTWAMLLFLIGYILVANVSFARQIQDKSLNLKYAPGFMHSARYFKDSISLSRVYIDYGGHLSNCNWIVYADLYDMPIDGAFLDSLGKARNVNVDLFRKRWQKSVRFRVGGHEAEWNTWSKSNFNDLLEKKEISHIVLFPDGILSRYLHFSGPGEVYMNKKFTRLFNEDGYMIYKIE